MGRKRNRQFTREEIDAAVRMAETHDLEEIEARADKLVRQDSVFVWILAAVIGLTFALVRSKLPFLDGSLGGIEIRVGIVLGVLLAVYVAIILVFRHERVRMGLTIVLAHRIKKSALEAENEDNPAT